MKFNILNGYYLYEARGVPLRELSNIVTEGWSCNNREEVDSGRGERGTQ